MPDRGEAAAPEAVLRVRELWRYPVKSMRGEQLASVALDGRGLADDRRWAVRTRAGKLGSGKTTRRFQRLNGLFDYRAAFEGGAAIVETPDGARLEAGSRELDALLSERYGRELRVLPEEEVPHFDAGSVHVVTTASLRWLAERAPGVEVDRRRFRPNIVVEAPGSELLEERWIGRRLRVGGAELEVARRVVRCVMTTFPQSELPRRPRFLRRIHELNDACFGVYADVVKPGRVEVGSPVEIRAG